MPRLSGTIVSFYPDGFALAQAQYDAQEPEEPIAEEEIDDEWGPRCGTALIRITGRRAPTVVECARGCNYYREEDPIEEDVP